MRQRRSRQQCNKIWTVFVLTLATAAQTSEGAFSVPVVPSWTRRQPLTLLGVPNTGLWMNGGKVTTTTTTNAKEEYGPSKEDTVIVLRDNVKFTLNIKSYYPHAKGVPIIICHGGPSLPSQYLYPIAPLIARKEERPMIFYDQLGCGKSDEPKDLKCYSIQQSVTDLEAVIEKVSPSGPFHLLGHSYGGVLVYEYVSCCMQAGDAGRKLPMSMMLSNTPTNLGKANSEYDRLWKKNPIKFWKEHACSVGMPAALEDALKHVGTVWSGMDVVSDYDAKPLAPLVTGNSVEQDPVPPTLIISGSKDFSLLTSSEDAWKEFIPNFSAVNLEDCAHYPFYEDGSAFAASIRDFLDNVETSQA